MPDLREKRVDLILQQLEELPTLPSVAVRVLEVTSSSESSAGDVVKLISSDPSLSARILHLVHRADLGVRGDVTSVDRAVKLLGFEAVRSAVLAISVFETFRSESNRPALIFSRDEFWKHCVAVACCAELLAVALKKNRGGEPAIDPSEAFVCGLLHDVGKVALDAALPKSFARVVEAADLLRGNVADVERQVIGLDHMVVGKRLAERWGLPANLRDCIWLHGQLPQALPATVKNPRLVNLVTLADLLVREQHLGYSGNYVFTLPRQQLMDVVGLQPGQVDEALQQLVSHIEPRAKALGLGCASSTELYQQALSQANKELGRVTSQLASKNRRLAIRAKFFDALAGFQSELRPDAPPQLVLQAIVQTALEVLDVPVAAVFSLPPGREYAESVVMDRESHATESSLIDCLAPATQGQPSTRPPTPDISDGPVLSVGDSMEWLTAPLSPRLGGEHLYWICLQADGVCIGGVLWGAPAGESQRLSVQTQELTALACGWSLALRTTQIREEARTLAEQLAEANRQLQNAQSEILRSKTLITVGEMAAGAAHEMNNPLAVISGRSQLLAMQLTDPKLKASAHLIYEQSQRLSDLITELMHFAKPSPPAIVESELGQIVHRAIAQAKQQADPADRTIEANVTDVPRVLVDPAQIQAALVEVLSNAIQATDAKTGRIEINAAFDPYSLRVVVSVADNGCGMEESTLRHAFDPFFSSKPAGRRRGMGLAKALRWIESSGGSIRLESRIGHGTQAIILLPAVRSVEASATSTVRKAL